VLFFCGTEEYDELMLSEIGISFVLAVKYVTKKEKGNISESLIIENLPKVHLIIGTKELFL